MRTLPSALLAAQRSASAIPYVQVEIADRIGGIRRLGWQRLYSGSEADSHHAATMPADGSLIRCRLEGGSVYRQRVTSPGPGSNFSNWTLVDAAASAGVALASQGAQVLLKAAREALLKADPQAFGVHLEAPAELETAIAAALGEYLDSVILDKGDSVETALDLLSGQASRGV
ncbi:MAG: hypothetical protein ACUVV3_09670, partial [Dehalococcoidia bacterium]